jgi:hypothetical protein
MSGGGGNSNPTGRPEETTGEGVGWRRVGPTETVFLSLYLLAFTLFIAYSLTCFWIAPPPSVPPPGGTPPVVTGVVNPAPAVPSAPVNGRVMVHYFAFQPFSVSYEVVVLVVAALCGALGAMVHALRSLSWYIGNRELRRSWIAKYVMQPFVGGTLALVFYFVARAGFISGHATAESANLIGFAAMAGLVGLFSDQAVLKLKDVAETLFTKPKPGADPAPQNNESGAGGAPVVRTGNPEAVPSTGKENPKT